ncbi:alpha/beta fold hydrolase [Domibacillus sp. DTU_2020_1001157_1_SI_ALB_TIR_016]|uniref:alpha/beta hydrolase n=1 Tax=Domibacillus sp. DTU_2020_1001157_1_SI_ALB_TIR_016 TaxID=3077789 RepID=UPI0028E1B63A|nr:alpha/beta fold hydrolase [Domibacillus sp. DTU_2020_1001157_1_SI_ALB_TIR_016]WNS78308.1 alpha/beta fold hydrolase [Domibacillus sp. DTU_2020_1001157_1_SI_ALB_TIR_016]
MKVVAPKSFTYRGGNKAVLLLHGFTGSTIDVRKLGKYLQERGFTCHAPLYKGHGQDPEELIQTGPADWWQDVLEGYHFLRKEGYEDIAVAGVSLGGLFSLKVGIELPVIGVVSMCAPVKAKNVDDLFKRVLHYARGYKKLEGKEGEQITEEMKRLAQTPMQSLTSLQQLILQTSKQINLITSPILVLQGSLDDPLYKESAKVIYENAATKEKQMKWYEQSGHIITLGKEKEKVYEDVHTFLNQLDWQ